MLPQSVAAASLLSLALLGGAAARAGGAHVLRPVARVVFWGALAMAITTAIGAALGVAV
ncbi:MAG: VIT family protein, partial [Phycisphaerales bacterium]|nr:VIT family protein [Hyphomonadaceae bacterium]